MNDEPETEAVHRPTRQPLTHSDGAVLLPIHKMGCRGCVGGARSNGGHFEESLAKYRCSDLPACVGIIWAPDTPDNRVEFVAQRMQT